MSSLAMAQAYPSKPITLVVPAPPGGVVDGSARQIGEGLARQLGQPIVIDNRGGASGNIGYSHAARAPADGYTLLTSYSAFHLGNPALFPKPGWAQSDFVPVAMVAVATNVIAVHPSIPANTLPELIALLKKEPGKFSYGSDGNGTASHLGMEILKARANVQLTHIPYKGSTPMITDLLGGTLMVGVTGLPAVQQHLKAGKLKMIAITTPQRAPGAPDYKTVAEQGFANFNAAPWAGFFAPKGTPKPVVDKLALDLADALKQADVAQKMNDLGSTVVGNKPDEFRQFVTRQIEMWAEGVKISGATVD
jgi:hypothetical protein